MLILAADTSTDWLSVALWRDGKTLTEFSEHMPRRHSEMLLEITREIMVRAGIALGDVDRFAVTHGPGSFTGVRIGVSTWKGLACAAQKPLVGVSTLEAMALGAPSAHPNICPMLDAKMAEVYAACYRRDGERMETVRPESAIAPTALLNGVFPGTVFLGDGALLYADAIRERSPKADILGEEYAFPHAAAIAALAARADIDVAQRDAVKPIYLRRSQAEELRANPPAGAAR
jgi:tRNA threonylcarbamoyladenosine biosynthesis protein TsaB